jgi:hypothetical protein
LACLARSPLSSAQYSASSAVEEKPSTDFGASLGCALTFAGAARGRRRDENEVRAKATALRLVEAQKMECAPFERMMPRRLASCCFFPFGRTLAMR